MSVDTEQKMNSAKKSKVRSSRTGASHCEGGIEGSALAKVRGRVPKNQVNGVGADTLFENRLVMMSSLRKTLSS